MSLFCKPMSLSIMQWIKNKIKSFDSFSESVELSYIGDTKYTTFVGGCTTLTIMLLIVAYGISLSITLFGRGETRTSKNTIFKDLSDSPPTYILNRQNFGLAHAFRVNLTNSVYDESYFNVRYYQVVRTLDESNSFVHNITEYHTELCDDDYPFEDIEFLDRSGLRDNVYCPSNQDYVVVGAFTNTIHKYIEVKVSKCNNSTYNGTCKPIDEINQALMSGDFSIGLQNRYIDFDDYENPIKKYIKNQVSYRILKNF